MIFRLLTVFLLGVGTFGSGFASDAPAPYAFVNVNVLPMDSEIVLTSQTVVIEDGRIGKIGPVDEIQLPPNTREIRADGLYLMPGLAEMHAHIPGLAKLADETRIDSLAKATAKAHVWIVPTQTLLEHWALYPAADTPQVFNVPGIATHQELELLVASGLTPYEALRTGTVNPARYFGAEDQFGRVREGLSAELILLEGNPLADITNTRKIRGVMFKGQWLDREQISQGLAFWAIQ